MVPTVGASPTATAMSECTVSLTALTGEAAASADALRWAATNGYVAVGPTFALRNDENIFQTALDAAAPISEMASSCVSFMFAFDNSSSGLGMTSSDKYVRISPPPAGAGQATVYYQYTPGDWRRVPNQRMIGDHALFVVPSYFSYYQVFAAAANLPFSIATVYVYPNPSIGGAMPTIHVELSVADHVTTRIYDVGGDLVDSGEFVEGVSVAGGKVAYELKLDPAKYQSGVYVGVVTAERDGKDSIRQQFRFTVIK